MGSFVDFFKGTLGIQERPKIEMPDAYQADPYAFLADPAYNEVTADLFDITQGTGQTISERVGAQESQKAQRAAASLMASQRGMNPALAAKLAGEQASQIRGDMAGKISTNAMLERERTRNALLEALEKNRQARIDRERIQAGATGQANAAAVQAQSAEAGYQQAQNQAAYNAWANIGTGIAQYGMSGAGGSAGGSAGPSAGDIAYGGLTPEGRSVAGAANDQPMIANKALTRQSPDQQPNWDNYVAAPLRYSDPRNNPDTQVIDANQIENRRRYSMAPIEVPYEIAQGDSQRKFYQGLIDAAKEGGWMQIDGEYKWEAPTGNVNPEWVKLANQYQGPSKEEWLNNAYTQKMRNKPEEVRNA